MKFLKKMKFVDWLQSVKRPRHLAKLEGKDFSEDASGHSYQTLYNLKAAGYTVHTFSDDLSQLTSDFIEVDAAGNGQVVYSFVINKGSVGGILCVSPMPFLSPPSSSFCSLFPWYQSSSL